MSRIEDLVTNVQNDYLNFVGLKIRYVDWTNIKYFQVQAIDVGKRLVHGFFDNGEEGVFDLYSDFWELYNPNFEYPPRAV